jgi:cytochrome c553
MNRKIARSLFALTLAGGGLIALSADAACGPGHGGGMSKMGCAAMPAATGDATRGRMLAIEHCARCHGSEGNATDPAVPSLAGQKASYLLIQLQNFRSGGRHNALMTPVALQLPEANASHLAVYFSAQTLVPRPAASTPEQFARGRKLYEDGDLSRHVPACSNCHDAGPGHGPRARFPLLKGQSASYVTAQLKQFQNGDRSAMPPMMTMIASRLDDEDIRAVAAFASSQPQQ